MDGHTPKVVVLISGSGSNLQAIIDAVSNEEIDAQIALVISNKPGVMGLEPHQKLVFQHVSSTIETIQSAKSSTLIFLKR